MTALLHSPALCRSLRVREFTEDLECRLSRLHFLGQAVSGRGMRRLRSAKVVLLRDSRP